MRLWYFAKIQNFVDINMKGLVKLILIISAAIVVMVMIATAQQRNLPSVKCTDSSTQSSNQNRAVHVQSKQRDNTIPWLDIFKFVPNNVRLCSELFNGSSSLPDDFRVKLSAYGKVLASQRDRRVEGHTAMFPFNYKAYNTIVKAPFLKTVCETGFNGGHSTFGWLTSNPNVHVYSFDIGTHGYSRPMAAHLQELYPGRLTVTWGDSTGTLPKFRKEHPNVKCDLIIIDGGHTYDVCKADFYNFKEMANVDNILILDDYPTPGSINILGEVWEDGKQKGELSEFFNCNYHESTARLVHGFAVGKYLF